MGKIALGAAVLAAALVLLLGLAGKAGAILPAGENPGYASQSSTWMSTRWTRLPSNNLET